jgi:hypothetical protein
MVQRYKIKHKKSTSYHPQVNDQVEIDSRRDSNQDSSTPSNILGRKNSRVLVFMQKYIEKCYRLHLIWIGIWKVGTYPIEFQINTFKIATKLRLNMLEAQQQRILQLNELDELHQDALQRKIIVQTQ